MRDLTKLRDACWEEMPDGMRANVKTFTDVRGPGHAIRLDWIYVSRGGVWVPKNGTAPEPLRPEYPASALVPDLNGCPTTRAVLLFKASTDLADLTRRTLGKRNR